MDYRTGLLWQDTQHRTLIEMFDRVGNLAENGGDCGEASDILRAIMDFAAGHFAVEEAYMETLAYPDREEHMRAHAGFLGRLEALVARNPVADSEMLGSLTNQLSEWFLAHILDTDRRLARFIRERDVA